MVNYSQTTRNSWTEARYGSETQYLEITSGQEVTDLVRGLDRTWRISPAGKYLIEFDMDKASMKATLLSTKGNGTESNPFQIANKYDLQSLRDRLVDGRVTYAKLTDDIDMQGEGWWPLNSTFYANSYEEGYGKAISLDGNNHVIKNLTVAANNEFETGLFGALVGNVTNLGLYNVTVESGKAQDIGILAGRLGTDDDAAIVDKCYVNGKLVATGDNDNSAAGAVAGVAINATVSNVYTNACVSGNGLLGDFIAIGSPELTVRNSYSAGKANDSQATAAIADNEGCNIESLLYFGVQNQEEICDIVSGWDAWHEDGTVGLGWPLLQWQVERGDHAQLCGFGEEGDVNHDGNVNLADAQTVLGIMARDDYEKGADVNNDGFVNLADYQTILGIMARQ